MRLTTYVVIHEYKLLINAWVLGYYKDRNHNTHHKIEVLNINGQLAFDMEVESTSVLAST